MQIINQDYKGSAKERALRRARRKEAIALHNHRNPAQAEARYINIWKIIGTVIGIAMVVRIAVAVATGRGRSDLLVILIVLSIPVIYIALSIWADRGSGSYRHWQD